MAPSDRDGAFVECPTRLVLDKEAPRGPFASLFVECAKRHSTKIACLPSASTTSLGKEALPVNYKSVSITIRFSSFN
jgi:hypothetical protein